MGDLVEAALVEAAVLQGPELGRQRTGRRLQQGRQEDMIGAEAHAVAAQGSASLLVEGAHLLHHLGALQHAERLHHLIADALGQTREVGGGLDLHQGAKQAHHVGLQPGDEAGLDLVASGARELLVGEQAHMRLEQLVAGRQLGDRVAGPADDPVVAQHEGGVGGRREPLGAGLDLAAQRLFGRAAQGLGLMSFRTGVRNELEAMQVADMLALDGNVPAGGDLSFQHRILSQAPHQDAGAPIDETAREAFVQGVGQPVLYPTRLALPMHRIDEPIRPVRHEGPGPPLRDALGERVDVAVGAVDHRDVLGEPIVGNAPRHAPHQEAEELGDEVGVRLGMDLAVIRHAADVPQPLHVCGGGGHVADVVLAHQDLEGRLVLAHGCPGQPLFAGVLVEARLQRLEGGEVEVRVAPLQHPQGLEIVIFQGFDHLGLEGPAAPRRTEGAVGEVAPGPARDLAHLRGGELAKARAVVLPVRREGDVIHVEVQAHAHRVGGDEVVDVARLVELDLRVAGARREGAQHHRRAAALAPDQFRDGVDLLGREGDDGGAPGQAAELLLARIGQLREARAGRRVHAGDQRLHQGQHGGGADEQRLLAPALVQQPVGEDVAPVHVGGKLDLVDGDVGHVEVARHGLDGGDPVARPVGLDLLLAGDEGDLVDADLLDHAQVDLPRQQPQGQADHARRMGEHALDGEMGLAGIGRPEHRRDAACAGLRGEGGADHG